MRYSRRPRARLRGLALTLAIAAPAHAQLLCNTHSLVSNLELPASDDPDVRVAAPFAYVTSGFPGRALRSLDVRRPREPRVLDTLALPSGAARLDIEGDAGYVLDIGGTMHIVDLSDPGDLAVVGVFLSDATTLDVAGGIACLGTPTGLRIVSVSDSAHPSLVGFVPLAAPVLDVAVSGSLAFVADGTEGMKVIDIRDPASASVVGALIPIGFTVAHVAVSGSSVCLSMFETARPTSSFHRFQLVDVADATAPTPIGSWQSEPVNDIEIRAGIAYVATDMSTQLLDVSRPHAIRAGSTFAYAPFTRHLDVSGNLLYVTYAGEGLSLSIIHVPSLGAPMQAARARPRHGSSRLDIVGGLACFPDGNEVSVYDVSDPTNPTLVSTITPTYGHGVYDVLMGGSFVFLAGQALDVVDLSDPSNPVTVASLPLNPGGPERLAWAGPSRIIATKTTDEVVLVDVSIPSSPVKLGSFQYEGWIGELCVANESLALVLETNSLRFLDISDPAAPFEVGVFGPFVSADHVMAVGDRAYLADPALGFRIIDISDPAHPTSVTDSFAYPDAIVGPFDIQGSFAVVCDNHYTAAGMLLVDLSTPTPSVLARTYGMHLPRDIRMVGDYAYVTDAQRGLRVIHLGDCDPCVADLDADADTDVFDFGVLASHFGRPDVAAFTDGDLDGDSDVDVFDFAIVAANLGCNTLNAP